MNSPDKPLRMIDLFAGCGGMTQGFVDAGFEPVLAVELNPNAAATYAVNFDPDVSHTMCCDIADVDSSMVPEADIVIGGPPCQGFSSLGRQDVDDPRNKLWSEYIRVVLASKAKVFVIENVDRFIKSDEFKLLADEVETGALSDFEISVRVLDAADYGVSQRRKRTIIVGSRIGTPTLPAQTHSKPGALLGHPWRTVQDALAGVCMNENAPDSLPATKSEFFERKVGGPYSMAELHFGRNPTQLSRDRYQVIPPGGGRHDLAKERPDLLPPCWRNKPSGTVDVMGRLEWTKPSVTIRTEFFKPEKGRYLHPEWSRTSDAIEVDRPITHREAALIQGFPDDFRWCGSKSEIARQIGNAVPPPLAFAIATKARTLLTAQAAATSAMADSSCLNAD